MQCRAFFHRFTCCCMSIAGHNDSLAGIRDRKAGGNSRGDRIIFCTPLPGLKFATEYDQSRQRMKMAPPKMRRTGAGVMSFARLCLPVASSDDLAIRAVPFLYRSHPVKFCTIFLYFADTLNHVINAK